MALRHVLGLDHVVVTVRDLDAAAANWRALGFTVSPRGTHSAHMGTGNYTLMLGDDYIELLGVLAPTEQNAPTRRFLERREGIERAAFTTDNAEQGAAELKQRGIAAIGPVHFSRPVDLPGGATGEAAFNVFRWPPEEAPGTMRIFACQHLTRGNVWIPGLSDHKNGASRIVRLEIIAADPYKAATQMSRLIDQPVSAASEGCWRVPSGDTRGDFLFCDAEAFRARHGAAAAAGAPDEGCAALVLATNRPDAAKALPGAVDTADGFAIPASRANGVMLLFTAP